MYIYRFPLHVPDISYQHNMAGDPMGVSSHRLVAFECLLAAFLCVKH